MGQPKGLLPVGGVPLIRRHVEAFAAVGLPTTVVLGAAAEAHIEALLNSAEVVVNGEWRSTDMSASAALVLGDAGVVLLTPVDVPPARPDTLRRLLTPGGDAVPTWQGVAGHPVRLVPPHPPGRLDHRLAGARRIPVDDPDCLLNLNTPEAWAAWSSRSS